MTGLSRRGLFLGRRVSQPQEGDRRAPLSLRPAPLRPPALRPPWAVGGDAGFTAACTGCGDCVPVCEPGLLSLDTDGEDADGKAVASFAAAGCTLCGDCAAACRPGALSRTDSPRPWPHVAQISADCLSFRGVECRMCGDHCTDRAISFRPLIGGRSLPFVTADACSGCGACLAPCPVGAVSLISIDAAPPTENHATCA